MKNVIYSILWIVVPFIGTIVGSSLVYCVKNDVDEKYKKIFLGFACGVMIAASIWSLLLPSLDLTDETKTLQWFPCTVGFLAGIFFLMIVNIITEKLEDRKKFNMLMFSITLHNIPEGMIVGIGLAGFLSSVSNFSLSDAVMIAIGIAVQNIPDGAIVSLPLKFGGKSEKYSFWMGTLSGAVEPIAAIFTIIISNSILPYLPYLLAFACGAMFYVVINELIPEMCENGKKNWGIVGFAIGFVVMMVLDVCI